MGEPIEDNLPSPITACLGERGFYQRISSWNSLLYVPTACACHIVPGRDAYAELLASAGVRVRIVGNSNWQTG
jgi:hypothetical protein